MFKVLAVSIPLLAEELCEVGEPTMNGSPCSVALAFGALLNFFRLLRTSLLFSLMPSDKAVNKITLLCLALSNQALAESRGTINSNSTLVIQGTWIPRFSPSQWLLGQSQTFPLPCKTPDYLAVFRMDFLYFQSWTQLIPSLGEHP